MVIKPFDSLKFSIAASNPTTISSYVWYSFIFNWFEQVWATGYCKWGSFLREKVRYWNPVLGTFWPVVNSTKSLSFLWSLDCFQWRSMSENMFLILELFSNSWTSNLSIHSSTIISYLGVNTLYSSWMQMSCTWTSWKSASYGMAFKNAMEMAWIVSWYFPFAK